MRGYDRPRPHAFCRGRGVHAGHLQAVLVQHVSAAVRQNSCTWHPRDRNGETAPRRTARQQR